ncbi:MAG: bifunctional (p)ppGpp synthetase/guanosine-3',5'-bis(diphosphate) 3'-pyrophosphohydrolase [candidate division Zixibacteria bacterium]|nr:bifunctional (p)ppGpp synthetase/guanosine-3',5'-bis(diphosphate) 3'-pyrophosphohydrolase [candidate division Zixibacteria bacterium]
MNLAEFIIQIESFNANVNILLIRKAYEFSNHAHDGQKRSSGEPYIQHCLEVAFILAEQHMDSATIVAGLIHDVVEDTEISLEHIRREFSDEIAELVDGVTKIGAVHFASREEQQVEYFRKMLLTMSRDIRVILIKLADRLHNMRTLQYLSKEKQKIIASETREVYAPLAHRFGINKIKTELEDLSLKYLEEDIYNQIVQKINERKEERDAYILEVVKPIKKALKENNISATVNGRAKHLDSIYRKERVRKVPFEEIYDLFAIRVIVNSERDCYHTMGILHTMWKPVSGRFHDYIANPKQNGYRSLHTTVIGPRSKMVEIQIRTHQMHYISENGIAAHWLYKEGKQTMSKDDRQMIWLRDVLEWQRDMTNPSEFLEYLKIDLYTEDIFVYTPEGKLINLPRGSTPLDFAFSIHTEVGIHCAGAKINNRLMPLSTELNTADSVEIITNQNRSPSHDWLKLVKTTKARSKIKKWLKQAGLDQFIQLGKQIVERELKRAHIPYPTNAVLLETAEKLDKKTIENLFSAIGEGSITSKRFIDLISPAKEVEQQGFIGKVIERIRGTKGIKVHGMDNMMFRFAGCCQPVPGEDIVGFITRGRGVTIHRNDCQSCLHLQEQFPERKIEVSWDTDKGQSFVVELEMVVEDRKNMLRDITQAIADANTNVRAAEMFSKDTTAVGLFVVEVASLSHLNRIFDKIKKIKGVISVRRSKGSDKTHHYEE